MNLSKKYFVLSIIFLLVLSSCKDKITEPEPEKVIISEKVVELDDATKSGLQNLDTNGVIIFTTKTKKLEGLKVGDYIAAEPMEGAPYGFLKRVENISLSADKVTLYTSNATLEDVFEVAEINFEKKLTIDDIEPGSFLNKGVTLSKTSDDGFSFDIDNKVLYDYDGNENTDYDQIVANGGINITPTFKFDLEIKDYQIELLRFTNLTTEEADLEIKCGGSISYETEPLNIATVNFTAITIWVGYVPIVIQPVLSVDVGAEANATVIVTTSVTQSASLEAGIEYSNGSWNPVNTFNKSFEFEPPQLTASAGIKGWAGPTLSLNLYGIAGPYADIKGYLELNADIYQTPWWELYGGADVGVGVKVVFLGKTITDKYFEQVLSYRTLITQAEGVLSGTIKGIVKDAVTQSYLQNVKVKVLKSNSLVGETVTNSDGEFNIEVQVGENYIVEFSKSGYINVNYSNIQVAGNTETNLEPVLQIDNSYAGNGNLSGQIINALTGGAVPNVTLNFRQGINNKSGVIYRSTITNSSGFYYLENVPAGNYTVEGTKTDYVPSYFSVISIGGTTTANQDATITPILNSDEIRIILTWGETPSDLDSHLTGPDEEGGRFHTYFSNEEYKFNGEIYADLDLDDITSYGPETTTIYKKRNGIYRFSVHDYTNKQSTFSTALANSNAQVRVYKGSELLKVFYVPSNKDGTLWTVFELFDNTIVPKNIMSYESDPSEIQKRSEMGVTDAKLMWNLPDKN